MENKVTRLIMVRHAEAEGNVSRVFHGWTDSGITENGQLQAARVAERLKSMNIDVLYSSSMKRSMQTASYISSSTGLPVMKVNNLKEINGGSWEGVAWSVLPVIWPAEYDTWENKPHIHKMPHGESMAEFQSRLIREIQAIITENCGRTICIVTHGTAIKTLMCFFYSCTLDDMLNISWFDNTSVTIIDYANGIFSIIAEGDTSHLDQSMKTIENQDWWIELNKSEDKEENLMIMSLFKTEALKVCPADKRFWYTSGTMGPFYMNTHYLYGGPGIAEELLKKIDRIKSEKYLVYDYLAAEIMRNYESEIIFKNVIDRLVSMIKNEIPLGDIDYISGGERRDWFFSIPAAYLLDKPHITIFKDLSSVISYNGSCIDTGSLEDADILHIADLVTEASSYERQWIPAISSKGGRIRWSAVIIDRMQGGSEFLKGKGIEPHALTGIDAGFFKTAESAGFINNEQLSMIESYIKDPVNSIKDFLKMNPQFIDESLNSPDIKTRERANLCLEKDFYGVGK